MNNNDIDNFFLIAGNNDIVADGMYSKMMLHKEKCNDRFYAVYIKDYKESLKQNDYSIGGYYDCKNHCIYDCNYLINKIFDEKSIVKRESFDTLKKNIYSAVDKYIEKYCFDHEEELKNNSLIEYQNLGNWKNKRYIDEIKNIFIKNDNYDLKLLDRYSEYRIIYNSNFDNGNIFVEYLDNPIDTIEKYSKLLIDKNKIQLGVDLLVYYNKIKYLNEIVENKDGNFDYLHLNKTIFNSINDVDARDLNITIKYNDSELTFKFDAKTLKSSLKCGDTSCSSYKQSYDVVANFLKDNCKDFSNDGEYSKKFKFSNITSITYGKKELYHKEVTNETKEIDNDLELEI